MIDPMTLPDDLPVPADDGAADHLPGARDAAARAARAPTASDVHLAESPDRTVVYAYPRTGVPGEDHLVPDWDEIPGARGLHAGDLRLPRPPRRPPRGGRRRRLRALDADTGEYQREAAERLALPFAILSDAGLELTNALRLPTFEAAGETLIKRLTLLVTAGRVERVWYPVFPPDRHAGEVLAWLRAN